MADGSPQPPVSSSSPPSPAATLNSNAPPRTLLKDAYYAAGVSTHIEVASDGIHISKSNGEHTLVRLDDTTPHLEGIDEDVRCQIARKIALMVPELDDMTQFELQKHTFNVLTLLAHDQMNRVRRIIADEMRSSPHAPPELIRTLAWDDDPLVALPVIEYSQLLGDTELIDIIATSEIPGVKEAIARRNNISRSVVEAIAKTDDAEAITVLLDNHGAQWSENAFDLIAKRAEQHPAWHRPILTRPEVSLKTVNRIASFVSAALMDELREKNLLPQETQQEVKRSVNTRLRNPKINREREAELRAAQMHAHGVLDNDAVQAAIDQGDREFIREALHLLSGLEKNTVIRMLQSGNAKVITALSWKAGLSMRLAMQLQLRIAGVHHTAMLNAKGGSDYPLSEPEIKKYLDLYLS